MIIFFKINNRINLFLDFLFKKYLIYVKGFDIGKNCKISRRVSFSGIYGNVRIGENCVIEPNVRFKAAKSNINRKFVINIKSNVFIGYGTIIDANSYIEIGKNSMIGPYVLISDGNYIMKEKNVPIASQGGNFKETIIEENVWIGCQSQVLMGVRLGSNSIVAANSTVVKSMDGSSLIVGTPAKIKKNIF